MDGAFEAAKKAHYRAIESGHTYALQEMACSVQKYAYYYVLYIKGADIIYCQEAACK
jgi:hypothetical protein